MQDAELQASLTFVGEKAEADLDGAADGVVPAPRVLSRRTRPTPRSVYFRSAQSSAPSTSVPERDLLDQHAVGELQQQRHAFEAIRQQRRAAPCCRAGTGSPAESIRSASSGAQLADVDSTALVGRRARPPR